MTHHEGEAGSAHGPAHPGDLSSAEPGGFDEFDHAPASAAADAAAAEASGAEAGAGGAPQSHGVGQPVVSDGTFAEGDDAEPVGPSAGGAAGAPLEQLTPDAVLAAERLADLRRLQAEYVNYKKRVDRDRAVARELGIIHVVESLLPVLDDIHMAREHGDLASGPFSAIAEKLESTLARLGIERFGAPGEAFDPAVHEALMHIEAELDPAATTTTVVHVLQPGYRSGERVVRAARVAVADPQ